MAIVRYLLAVLAACLYAGTAQPASAPLSQTEQLGRRIYQQGAGTTEIEAQFTASGVRASGRDYPCVKCHGESGRGGREAGVAIADISPQAMAARRGGDRDRAKDTTEQDLIAAITKGANAEGAALHPAMPRYRMSKADMTHLLAYLKRLGNEPVPGVTDDEIRIGMPLPSGGLAPIAHDVQQLLTTYFSEINQAGGIYGRKLSLHAKIMDAADAESLFCVVAHSPSSAAADPRLTDDMPAIAPLMIFPEASDPRAANAFFMYAGLQDQGRVLIDFLGDASVLKPGKIALLHTNDTLAGAGAHGARQQASALGLRIAADRAMPAGEAEAKALVEQLRSQAIDQIIYFGSMRALEPFAQALQGWQLPPLLLGSAELLGGGSVATKGFDAIFLASSIGAPDLKAPTMADYVRLVRLSGLNPTPNPFLMNAYAGARVLVDALKENGRTLTRTSFVRTLQTLKAIHTGVGPMLHYSATERQGTRAVTILSFEAGTGRLQTQTPFREAR